MAKKLHYVFPCSAALDRADIGARHSVVRCDGTTGAGVRPNRADVIIRQLGRSCGFSQRPVSATSRHLIPHVVSRSTNAKVRRVHARRVVTGMQDALALGNRPDVELVGKTVRQHLSVVVRQCSVPVHGSTLLPLPAVILPGFGESDVEPFFKRSTRTAVGTSVLSLPLVVLTAQAMPAQHGCLTTVHRAQVG